MAVARVWIMTYCNANPFDVTPPANGQCKVAFYDEKRKEFIKDCQKDTPIFTQCDTAVISDTSTETVKNCTANPFLTGCLDGGEPLSILIDSGVATTYCTMDATLFQMKCDNYVGNARTDLITQCDNVTNPDITPRCKLR